MSVTKNITLIEIINDVNTEDSYCSMFAIICALNCSLTDHNRLGISLRVFSKIKKTVCSSIEGLNSED